MFGGGRIMMWDCWSLPPHGVFRTLAALNAMDSACWERSLLLLHLLLRATAEESPYGERGAVIAENSRTFLGNRDTAANQGPNGGEAFPLQMESRGRNKECSAEDWSSSLTSSTEPVCHCLLPSIRASWGGDIYQEVPLNQSCVWMNQSGSSDAFIRSSLAAVRDVKATLQDYCTFLKSPAPYRLKTCTTLHLPRGNAD